MIETIDNISNIFITAVCAGLSAYRGLRGGKRAWLLLAFASGVYFLGDLYWQFYLGFYGETPHYSNISYMCWYACYLFLTMTIMECREERISTPLKPENRLMWLIPVFTAGMCAFYMQWGDVVGNIVSAATMTALIWNAVDGLGEKKTRPLCSVVLLFCFTEYFAWTASCYWSDDSLLNPYFWGDFLLSATFAMLPAAVGKAVRE